MHSHVTGRETARTGRNVDPPPGDTVALSRESRLLIREVWVVVTR